MSAGGLNLKDLIIHTEDAGDLSFTEYLAHLVKKEVTTQLVEIKDHFHKKIGEIETNTHQYIQEVFPEKFGLKHSPAKPLGTIPMTDGWDKGANQGIVDQLNGTHPKIQEILNTMQGELTKKILEVSEGLAGIKVLVEKPAKKTAAQMRTSVLAECFLGDLVRLSNTIIRNTTIGTPTDSCLKRIRDAATHIKEITSVWVVEGCELRNKEVVSDVIK